MLQSRLPPADLGVIEETLHSVKRTIIEAMEDAIPSETVHLTPPDVLIDSIERLLSILAHIEDENTESLEKQHINKLADYGLQLFVDLTYWAKHLNLSSIHDKLRKISFAFGWWLAQHGAEISLLNPIVDNLAFIVSGLTKPTDLEQAYTAASHIMDAFNLHLNLQNDITTINAWHKLILQRATIAILSQRPLLMEHAFQCLIEFIPEQAPSFFQDNMAQINSEEHSDAMRRVMEKYFHQWGTTRTLH